MVNPNSSNRLYSRFKHLYCNSSPINSDTDRFRDEAIHMLGYNNYVDLVGLCETQFDSNGVLLDWNFNYIFTNFTVRTIGCLPEGGLIFEGSTAVVRLRGVK